jgi:hypothetical protein
MDPTMGSLGNNMEYDLSIHNNPDAKAWADLFAKIHPNCNVDNETMLGWFANAMMAMHDYIHGSQPINGDHVQYLMDQ